MELTGKCKEDFERWHRKQTPEMGHWYSIINFNNLPLSMKYGVYVDFFLENEIHIMLVTEQVGEWDVEYAFQVWEFNNKGHLQLTYNSFHGHGVVYGGAWKLEQARIEAINKANEIYNKNK